MSENKHTPGPWALDPPELWEKVIRIEAKEDIWERLYVEVCRDDCDTATAEANARLIAAAPDLLAALLAIHEHRAIGNGHVPQSVFDQVNAAISKAEGK